MDSVRIPVAPNLWGEEGRIGVLDHGKGYVKLIAFDFPEAHIANVARVSTRRPCVSEIDSPTARLLSRLHQNRHTSPFEHVHVTLVARAPLFVLREWVRHRTAHYNEESARYAELEREFYIPDHWRMQDTRNKQSSFVVDSTRLSWDAWSALYVDSCNKAFDVYEALLKAGVAREMARMCLPLSTYSTIVWKTALHNLMHFLELRTDDDAQWEIRQYALAIERMVEQNMPQTFEVYHRTKWLATKGPNILESVRQPGEDFLSTLKRLVAYYKGSTT